MTCHACGATLASTARFCHKCGAAVQAAATQTGWRAGLPWAVAGAALGALVTVAAMRFGGGSSTGSLDAQAGPPPAAGGAPFAPFAGGAGGGGGRRPPDISQMSPEERAGRLYNRVMMLHSAGKTDSAEFFLPMALQAYNMLPELDVDARYHVGVLHLTGGDAAGAAAQADTILQMAPTHLFGFMLRAHASELRKDTGGIQRAYRDFLRNEAAERAKKLPEYADHAQNLDSFHEQAQKGR
jgi:hypothetical protein